MPDTNLPSASNTSGTQTGRRVHPSIIIVIIVILLYLGLNTWIYLYGTKIFNFNLDIKNLFRTVSVVKEQGGTSPPVPTPVSPRIRGKIYPLPTGTQSWKFSGGKANTDPTIQTATVDPLTPAQNATQTVTITAKHSSPITATATLFTDNKKQTADMKLTAGSATDGTWSVKWKIDDTYFYTYHIDFVLTSATGQWKGALTFR
jgi:hypothetical protein